MSDDDSDGDTRRAIVDRLAALSPVKIPKKVPRSEHLLQFTLLKSEDPKRLEPAVQLKSKGNNKMTPTHECKHCKSLVFL